MILEQLNAVNAAMQAHLTSPFTSDEDHDAFLAIVGGVLNPRKTNFQLWEKELVRLCSEPAGEQHLGAAHDIGLWMLHQREDGAQSCGFRVLNFVMGQGWQNAANNVAIALIRGDGTKRSPRTGRSMLLSITTNMEFAPHIRARSHALLASFWEAGDFGTVDKAKALQHFKRAAELGDAGAAFNVGLSYDDKTARPNPRPNFELAAHYYQISSDLGYWRARTNLGILHACLKFPAADPDLGIRLLKVSAAEGDALAENVLAKLANLQA